MRLSRLLAPVTILTLAIFAVVWVFSAVPDASAKSGRGFGGGGSYSRGFTYTKSSPWSGQTHKTWDRRGGGIFGSGPGSSSGYAKPSLGGSAPATGYSKPPVVSDPSSSGYSKLSLQKQGTSPGESKPSPVPGQTSSGYSKPSLGTAAPPGASSPTEPGNRSSGYTKPSLQSSSSRSEPVKEKAGSSGYSKPTAGPASQQKVTAGTGFSPEALSQERKKRAQESLLRYKSENSRFQKPPPKLESGMYESNPLYDKAKVYSGFDYGSHYDRRDSYYRSTGYQPPSYAYNLAPRFGVFDTLFLFWMLNHMSNRNVAAAAYNYSEDPGFKKWRQEVEGLAKDNPELKAKLDEMDKQIKSFQGSPKDPGYLPDGVPPEVALAPDVLATKKPERPPLRFATGRPGGWYEKYGALLKREGSGLDVSLIPTDGSKENLKLLVGGKADAAVVQSDALAILHTMLPGSKLISEQATLYPEPVHLIANRSSSVQSIRDIDAKRNVLYAGPEDSGTSLTWQAFCEYDPRLRNIPVRHADYSAALAEVESNPRALMLFVGGLNSDFLKKAEVEAEKSGNLRLVTVDDQRFRTKRDKHGNPLYRLVTIDSKVYPALQKGWIFSGDVKTMGVQAVLVLRTAWAEKYGPEAMDALSQAVAKTLPEIRKMVNADK